MNADELKELEQEVDNYIDEFRDLVPFERKRKLMELFEKWLKLEKEKIELEGEDWLKIKDFALNYYKELSWPKQFRGTHIKIDSITAPMFCYVLGTIGLLDRKGALKKDISFKYKGEE